MKGSTHMLIGVAVGLAWAVATQSGIEASIIHVGAAALGSTLPDIDHPGSNISRRAWPLRLGLFWLPHRGPTHSLIAMAAISWAAFHFAPLWGLSLAFGYHSHIIADMLTKRGVTLLWPLPYPVRLVPKLLSIRTGNIIESFISLGAVAVCLMLFSMLI